jgi:hypothetical protein
MVGTTTAAAPMAAMTTSDPDQSLLTNPLFGWWKYVILGATGEFGRPWRSTQADP